MGGGGGRLGAAPGACLPQAGGSLGAAPLDSSPPAIPGSNGAHARALIEGHGRHLAQLLGRLGPDADPEVLHQVRVSLRRLRTVLSQFAPALVLPRAVRPARLAAVARATGEARDLDVLEGRWRQQLRPRLDPADQPALRPLLRRLARRRQRAYAAALAALAAPRTARLLGKLERWQRQPRFTPLGHEPLADWLHAWHRPLSSALVLHPGWWADHPRDPQLHALRKCIKGVRYSLEALADRLEPSGADWIATFKQAQTVLGELHDLQVLEALLHEDQDRIPPSASQGVRAELERQRAIAWARWRELSGWLLRPECRAALPSLSPLPVPPAEAQPAEAPPAAPGS